MLHNIIVLEPLTFFCVTHDHVIIIYDVILTLNYESKNEK